MNKKIAITCGDFNGIGPEVIEKALNKLSLPAEKFLIIGSKNLFENLNDDYEFVEIPFKKEWMNIMILWF